MKTTTGRINGIEVKIIVVEPGERFTTFVSAPQDYSWMQKGEDYDDIDELKEYFPGIYALAAATGANLESARGIIEVRL